ncbi:MULTISPECIES: hypothetical protein [Mameliella]|uniref:Uncharacterized protein n=1 Tax=Mameliella alba TaxID=561184 RepID=A0A0B3SNY5_9RHOB|nr:MULTISPECIES: hypothetical protein [Mameliella]ODM49633.1 hypothetical protein A9320_14120 [Ruegeria sp. PBVC088]KHQ52139.1 hypothetical protein OA50_03154 [Mameliella alba]MBY6119990.1 hypothetical protein [Mameliella alba]MDD9733721.1 hypothetical protein [Mameliella sp. AT18]OWV45917.1 hypothetical protein CDZ95_02915 [Mameliella alba]
MNRIAAVAVAATIAASGAVSAQQAPEAQDPFVSTQAMSDDDISPLIVLFGLGAIVMGVAAASGTN